MDEALRMSGVGLVESSLALLDHLAVITAVDDRRREHGDAAVYVLVVVPVEESSAELEARVEAGEAIGSGSLSEQVVAS